MTRRVVALSAAVMAVTLGQSACSLAREPDPLFLSSSSTPKHTTIKAIAPTHKSASTPTSTSSAPKFPIPASARVKPTSPAATPATSTTIYRPSESTTIPTIATGSAPTLAGAGVGIPRTAALTPRRRGSSSPSTAAIIAAVLAALAVLASLVWGMTRWLVLEPQWVLSLRHSLDEAGFRVSATFSEFADWVRLGR